MGIIDVGSVLRLADGSIAVVTKITNAGSLLGLFYSVIVDGETREIFDMEIVEVIQSKDD